MLPHKVLRSVRIQKYISQHKAKDFKYVFDKVHEETTLVFFKQNYLNNQIRINIRNKRALQYLILIMTIYRIQKAKSSK